MKNNFFAGLALIAIAFTGAAFTANSTLQANHYVQKPNSCTPIPQTNCSLDEEELCEATDTSGTWLVYESLDPSDPTRCQNQLFREE